MLLHCSYFTLRKALYCRVVFNFDKICYVLYNTIYRVTIVSTDYGVIEDISIFAIFFHCWTNDDDYTVLMRIVNKMAIKIMPSFFFKFL